MTTKQKKKTLQTITENGLRAVQRNLSTIIEAESNAQDECQYAALSDAIMGVKASSTTWNGSVSYHLLARVLLKYMPVDEQLLSEIIPITSRLASIPTNTYESFFSKPKAVDDIMREIAPAIRQAQIGKGLTVAEIGGWYGAELMEALGAQTTSADAGFREFHFYHEDSNSSDLVDDDSALITLGNYAAKFDTQYDITISNKLLDHGSGVGSIAEQRTRSSFMDESGALELLAVFSNITKPGGLSIHNHSTPIMNVRKFYDYFGFDVVENWNGVEVLRKREPNPAATGEGMCDIGGSNGKIHFLEYREGKFVKDERRDYHYYM